MATYSKTLATDAPPGVALRYLADFSNAVSWDPGTVEARMLTTEPVQVGSEFLLKVRFLGLAMPMRYRVVEFDPHGRVVLEAGSPVRSRDTITVRPTAGGSTVTYEAVLTLTGLKRMLDPALHLAFQRVGGRAAAGLQRSLDTLGAAYRGEGQAAR